MNQTKPAGGGITMIESSGGLEYSIAVFNGKQNH